MIDVLFNSRGGPGCPPKISARWIKKIISSTLHFERVKRKIGVLVTDNRSIRRINKNFLNHDTATDVIAFDLGEGVGDIVVSVQMAGKVSKELGISLKEELARYLVHGTLHLLGYRDKKVKEKKRMHQKQEAILGSL